MKIIQTTSLTLDQKEQLWELWNSEYPVKIGFTELSQFENYLDGLSNKVHYLEIDDQNTILGWAFTFCREEQDWFAIIVNSEMQRNGLGLRLIEELKKNNLVLNGWVIDHSNDWKQNKQPYLSPLGFYAKIGFLVDQATRMENDTISAVKIRWEGSKTIASPN